MTNKPILPYLDGELKYDLGMESHEALTSARQGQP
jgi:hypothetical protein